MNKKYIISFILVGLLIIMMNYALFQGIELGPININSGVSNVNQGLDLRGGVSVLYEADTDATGHELDRQIDQVIEIFRMRVDGMGLTEPQIAREGDKRVRVEIPGLEDTQDAISMIGSTAKLEFIDPDGNIVITGEDVKDAGVAMHENRPLVILELHPEGAEAFSDATRRLSALPMSSDGSNKILRIVLDGEEISAPMVNQHISNGEASITGSSSVTEASELANLIRAGALPVDLNEVESEVVTARLGEEALSSSIKAAIIGISILLIFMLVFYRLSGLVANLALLLYIFIVFSIIIFLNATLTLPGIAALLLSVGMAVDANVIIFERFKEELAEGKSIRASVDAGFKRALTTILDANITTFIAGVILYQFGTGPVRGFAVLLMIGIISSLFTSLVVTKFLLKLIIKANISKNPKIFGI